MMKEFEELKELPSYKELLAESSKKKISRWQKFLCKIGIHKWKTVKSVACKAWCASPLFGRAVKVSAITVVKHCECCHSAWAYIDNGAGTRSSISLDYLRATTHVFDDVI